MTWENLKVRDSLLGLAVAGVSRDWIDCGAVSIGCFVTTTIRSKHGISKLSLVLFVTFQERAS